MPSDGEAAHKNMTLHAYPPNSLDLPPWDFSKNKTLSQLRTQRQPRGTAKPEHLASVFPCLTDFTNTMTSRFTQLLQTADSSLLQAVSFLFIYWQTLGSVRWLGCREWCCPVSDLCGRCPERDNMTILFVAFWGTAMHFFIKFMLLYIHSTKGTFPVYLTQQTHFRVDTPALCHAHLHKAKIKGD